MQNTKSFFILLSLKLFLIHIKFYNSFSHVNKYIWGVYKEQTIFFFFFIAVCPDLKITIITFYQICQIFSYHQIITLKIIDMSIYQHYEVSFLWKCPNHINNVWQFHSASISLKCTHWPGVPEVHFSSWLYWSQFDSWMELSS